MKKYLFALATLAIAVVACNKETDVQQPEKAGKRLITVIAETPETRTVLDDQHNALLWAPGDNFRLMTNTRDADANHDAQTLNYTENGKFSVSVSNDATEAYAYYFAGSYTDANHSTPTGYTAYIERSQTQTKAGVLNGQMLPMAAKGTINADNTVNLSFHQMAGVLALNIYSTSKVAGEVINSVTVTPTGNTKFCGAMYGTNLTADNVIYTNGGNENYSSVTVALGEPYDYASSKPADKKMFDGQIYVVLGKQSYSSVKFEIATNLGTYVITSSGAPLNLTSNDFYPVNINLAKAEYEESVAVLDWTYPTSGAATSAGIQAQPGVTAEGLGSDYGEANAPYRIKFDNTGDYIQIHTDKAIGQVSVKYKMIGGGSTSKLEIYESTLGAEWNKVEDLTISGNQSSTGELTTTSLFSPASRFVKIVFNKGSNVGIGGISITKGNTDPYIYAEDVTVPAKGVESEIAPYVACNFEDDVIVPEENGVTGCVTEAIALDGEIIFSVDPNYTTSPVAGTIVLCSQSNPSVTKTINVTQAASVFEASSTDAMAFAWDDKTNSEEKTVTITSTFALTKTDNVVLSGTNADKFSVSLTPVSNSTDDYTLSVSVIEDNESEADYEAVVTISRNNLAIAINLSQAKYSSGETYVLTSSQAAGQAYQYTVKTVTESDESEWMLFGYGKNNDCWQLGGNKGSGSGSARCSYILTPECTNEITTITVNCRGGNYVAIYSSDASTLLTGMVKAAPSSLGNLVFNLPSGYTQVKIMFTTSSTGSLSPGSNAACYISSVTVTTE